MLGLGTGISKIVYPYSTGLPAETQNYSVYLDGASDRIQGPNMSTTWLQVFDANAAFSLHFSIKVDALKSTLSTR